MGNVRLYGATSGYTELAPPAVAPDGVLSLPSGTGTIATQDYAAGAGGLVHINTTTFSAVSSVSLNDVFTSDYENYKVVFDLTSASTTAAAYFRLRASGSDITTAHYAQMSPGLTSGNAVSTNGNAGQTAWEWGTFNSAGLASMSIDVLQPYVATETRIGGPSMYYNGSIFVGRALHGLINLSTLVDGITYYPGSGTWTGTIRVYGYKNGA